MFSVIIVVDIGGLVYLFGLNSSFHYGCLRQILFQIIFAFAVVLLLRAKICHLKIKEQLLGKIHLDRKVENKSRKRNTFFIVFKTFHQVVDFHHFPKVSSTSQTSSLCQLFIRLSTFITFQSFHQLPRLHHFSNFSSGCWLLSGCNFAASWKIHLLTFLWKVKFFQKTYFFNSLNFSFNC